MSNTFIININNSSAARAAVLELPDEAHAELSRVESKYFDPSWPTAEVADDIDPMAIAMEAATAQYSCREERAPRIGIFDRQK